MARCLMEFGSGPVLVKKFHESEWYQGAGTKVEDYSDHPLYMDRGEHSGVVWFHWGEPPASYEITQAGLDYIKGEEEE